VSAAWLATPASAPLVPEGEASRPVLHRQATTNAAVPPARALAEVRESAVCAAGARSRDTSSATAVAAGTANTAALRDKRASTTRAPAAAPPRAPARTRA